MGEIRDSREEDRRGRLGIVERRIEEGDYGQ